MYSLLKERETIKFLQKQLCLSIPYKLSPISEETREVPKHHHHYFFFSNAAILFSNSRCLSSIIKLPSRTSLKMKISVAIAVNPAPAMNDPTRAKNPAPPPPLDDDAVVDENDRRVVDGICL